MKPDEKNKCMRNGDENMVNTNAIYPELNIGLILGKGTVISSHEALEDATPINWGKEVLNGDYRNKTIIKSKDKED